MRSRTIGLILAGGEARRFGGGKALAHLRGRPLALWVREALRPFCREIWLSLRQPEQAEGILAREFARVVLDPFPGEGPLSGILAGLRALAPGETLLVASCDQPLLKPALLQKLQTEFFAGDFWVGFCLNVRGKPEPFPGFYARKLLPFLEDYLRRGKRSLREWFCGLPPSKILGLSAEAWYPLDVQGITFLNINYREELEAIERFLS
ncbi:MAG TPA: molybdenum cofactor guanylyltransferase [Thermosulfurimonas dismutans]|uniref:Probable molybdenum cofactor guanylyltransferase n=1 Tax=Thermosulfurimonas dismutans TaxID=999894 RepID=A0A7C3CQM8_9BACT|nr:molybdenum cofactor guanylyltransferase [Thermosulfurimonas dismutans]